MNTDEDMRNVVDKYKHMPHDDIVADLDTRSHGLEIAIENLDRDYNMGTVIRNANAFGVRTVHIIGRRQWNKRGAMMTDKYLHVLYYESAASFLTAHAGTPIIAIDNVSGSVPMKSAALPDRCIMVFGSEKSGISDELLAGAVQIVAIEQLGSTRSVNVGVAAGIAMYAWLDQHVL